MFADMSTMDSIDCSQIFDNYSDMSDTQYKKRKIEYQPWEEPIAEFLAQGSNNTYGYPDTQEDILSISNTWSMEDFWLLENIAPNDLMIPPLNVPPSDDSCSPKPFLELFNSYWEQTGSTEASAFSSSPSPSPQESSNYSESEDQEPVEKKNKTSRKAHKSNKKKCSKKSQKKSAKKGQNRMKNFPGLIMQRVKTLAKRNSKFFIKVVRQKGLFLNEQEEFIDCIGRYNKDDKTWTSIEEFLRANPRFARGYLELVYSFLSDEKEVQEYLMEGKMSLKNKELLWEKREDILSNFENNLGSKFETEEYKTEEQVNYDK